MRPLQRLFLMGPHTCPWWFGYTFDNPLRRLIHNPFAILSGDLVREGQTAVDIGCGLGYFSLALAQIVGARGTVIALDLQSQMVQRARRRAARWGVGERIDFRVCAPDHLGVTVPVDFALAFWMVHEVADPRALLTEVRSSLRPSGHLLIVEPKIHVPSRRFEETVRLARATGFD
ncbi:MAG: class I SAM-dependent methyltransferase, partial [Gemmatimonadota bacterium]|nr:class I SAM-dependent methyltransferase [Gemmatimonadota bacterium]